MRSAGEPVDGRSRAVRFSVLAGEQAKGAFGAEDASSNGLGNAGKAQATQQHQNRVTQTCQHGSRRALAHTTGILTQRYITHLMQAILDPPMLTQ